MSLKFKRKVTLLTNKSKKTDANIYFKNKLALDWLIDDNLYKDGSICNPMDYWERSPLLRLNNIGK